MQSIDIYNFRCYEHLSVDFKKGINLLIGDNASGKTSLLMACKYVLGSFFSGFSDENTKWESPRTNDFHNVQTAGGTPMGNYPIELLFVQDNLFQGAAGTYSVKKNSKKNSKALVSGLSEYKAAAKQLLKNYYLVADGHATMTQALPLFASFTTEDIHTSRRIKGDQYAVVFQKPSFGYYECLNCNGLLKYWKKRILSLAEEDDEPMELAIVNAAVLKALGPAGCNIIKDIRVRTAKKKVLYSFVDGRSVEQNILSDGYKRLVNIVTDIAFRCALLNKEFYGMMACDKTKGTVLIDEIDMHLHPLLQAKVLKALHHTFPQLQFIVTTHAPMVMTGVVNDSENVVYRMSFDGEYTVIPVNTYGLDASQILRIVMGVPSRDSVVDARLQQLFDDIDEDKREAALSTLNEMTVQFGDTLPELARAKAMLDFSVEKDD